VGEVFNCFFHYPRKWNYDIRINLVDGALGRIDIRRNQTSDKGWDDGKQIAF